MGSSPAPDVLRQGDFRYEREKPLKMADRTTSDLSRLVIIYLTIKMIFDIGYCVVHFPYPINIGLEIAILLVCEVYLCSPVHIFHPFNIG